MDNVSAELVVFTFRAEEDSVVGYMNITTSKGSAASVLSAESYSVVW
jgi:hypothetical protein